MAEEQPVPREDIPAADRHARSNHRPRGVVPHHVRCNWMRGDDRCRLPDGHSDAHMFEVPPT